MKKGISLIVLVITIIVMIIIAGAIIISLNSSNVIAQANKAVTESDLANAQNAAMLAYAEAAVGNNGIAMVKNQAGELAAVTEAYYTKALNDAGFDASKYDIALNDAGIPTVSAKATSSN